MHGTGMFVTQPVDDGPSTTSCLAGVSATYTMPCLHAPVTLARVLLVRDDGIACDCNAADNLVRHTRRDKYSGGLHGRRQ